MPVEIRMPQISMTMIEGTVVKWLKEEGDAVAEGEDLIEIQTDKVVETLRSAASGTLLQIVARQDEIVPVGGLLCCIGQKGQQVAPSGSETILPVAVAPVVVSRMGAVRHRASPLAKKIAAQGGIDLSGITGTGPAGMIVKADLANVHSPARVEMPQLKPDREDIVVPITGIRKTIADNLMQSRRAAADVTTVADADMGAIRELRAVLPVTYTAFSVLAASKALREYPIMNALVEDSRIIMKKQINICVAVATSTGLLTPVIRDVGNKNLLSIAEDIADLSTRGREGKLTTNDFEGGTFTVSNSGVFGSIIFTPIINHPQSAILGLGRIAKVPVVKEDDSIVPALMMYMSLSYNHRSIDGETAVKFLQRIRYYLENPAVMLGLKSPNAGDRAGIV